MVQFRYDLTFARYIKEKL